MSATLSPSLTLHWPPTVPLTSDQLYNLCQSNQTLQIERTKEGDLIIMAPAGGGTSHRNAQLIAPLITWANQEGSGVVFDSSGGFDLPNGATFSPDAAWVRRSRLQHLSPAEKERFLPLCPDFVIELRSPSDNLKPLQDKMTEYIANGAELGWLIDPQQRRVYVYRPRQSVEQLDNPAKISGEPTLPNFILSLQRIWEPDF